MQVITLLWIATLFAQSGATVKVSGDISAPLILTVKDLAAMPHESFEIPDDKGVYAKYEGVPLQEILKKAGLPIGNVRGKNLSIYVLATATDQYQVVFSLGELDPTFGNTKVLLVEQPEGKPVDARKGPFWLAVPNDKAGARDVRMLEKLEIVRLRK